MSEAVRADETMQGDEESLQEIPVEVHCGHRIKDAHRMESVLELEVGPELRTWQQLHDIVREHYMFESDQDFDYEIERRLFRPEDRQQMELHEATVDALHRKKQQVCMAWDSDEESDRSISEVSMSEVTPLKIYLTWTKAQEESHEAQEEAEIKALVLERELYPPPSLPMPSHIYPYEPNDDDPIS